MRFYNHDGVIGFYSIDWRMWWVKPHKKYKSLHWVKIDEREMKFKKLVDLFWELVRPLKQFNKNYIFQVIYTWHRNDYLHFIRKTNLLDYKRMIKIIIHMIMKSRPLSRGILMQKNILHATTFVGFLSLLMREQVLWFMGWHLNATRRRRSKSWM